MTKKGRGQKAEGRRQKALMNALDIEPTTEKSKGIKLRVNNVHWLLWRMGLNPIREQNMKAFCPH
jgi:hypothetical protein